MKLRNILISGLGVMALTACDDYLDVEAPSKYDIESVFSSSKDVKQALNGVYAAALSSNTFGEAYTYSLILNTDVDYSSSSSETKQTNTPKRYDLDASSSTAKKVWDATYSGIENANSLCYNIERSSIFNPDNDAYTDLLQMLGEAKVLRAMFYYELLCYWGDVPFSLQPTSETDNFNPDIAPRDSIAKYLIEDLIKASEGMAFAKDNSEGIERASKEAAWAMIARIGLQAAGYSLRHAEDDATTYGYMGKPAAETEQWFLSMARKYSQLVIESGTHSLTKDYRKVFDDECNFSFTNDDDAIFEIPFAIESTGSIGYRQGPKFASSGGSTNFQWGETNGGQGVESLYRYSFKPGDQRKYVAAGVTDSKYGVGGWFSYSYDGTPALKASYSFYNMKWSKLYNTTSAFTSISSSSTGINFPYIRYADVLLMFAEADLKLSGQISEEAKDCVMKVRERAFRGATAPQIASTDPDAFLKEILNERKWEFAGENMRWKDLVRNNLLGETLYWTFMRNYAVAEDAGIGCSWSDVVQEYDGIDYFDNAMLPLKVSYIWIDNPSDNKYFGNATLPCIFVMNAENASTDLSTKDPVTGLPKHSKTQITQNPQLWFDDMGLDITAIAKPNDPAATAPVWQADADFYTKWYDENGGYPQAAVRYSLYGYIRGGSTNTTYGQVYLIENGVEKRINPGEVPDYFPAVRYLLPIPRDVITRSAGLYKNYYGY